MHTPEQIETWAREAGDDLLMLPSVWLPRLTRFAALVAQHERGRAVKVCEEIAEKANRDDFPTEDAVTAFACAAAISNSDGG